MRLKSTRELPDPVLPTLDAHPSSRLNRFIPGGIEQELQIRHIKSGERLQVLRIEFQIWGTTCGVQFLSNSIQPLALSSSFLLCPS
jgi:hypothetical protein